MGKGKLQQIKVAKCSVVYRSMFSTEQDTWPRGLHKKKEEFAVPRTCGAGLAGKWYSDRVRELNLTVSNLTVIQR